MQGRVFVVGDDRSPSRKLDESDALVCGASGDAEELPAVARSEPSVAFGDVRGDRDGGTGQLMGQNAVSAWEVRRPAGEIVGEIQCAAVDDEMLEEERHDSSRKSADGLLCARSSKI